MSPYCSSEQTFPRGVTLKNSIDFLGEKQKVRTKLPPSFAYPIDF